MLIIKPELREGKVVYEAARTLPTNTLLRAGGPTNALRVLVKAEQERGPDFLWLANTLSALYPQGYDEKRLLDAILLAMPR